MQRLSLADYITQVKALERELKTYIKTVEQTVSIQRKLKKLQIFSGIFAAFAQDMETVLAAAKTLYKHIDNGSKEVVFSPEQMKALNEPGLKVIISRYAHLMPDFIAENDKKPEPGPM